KEVDHPEGFGQIHRGFCDCYQAVFKELDRFVRDQPDDKKFIVTGHSLGGAIATLIAAYIRHNKTDKVMLYTFGSPRVGDSEFVDHFTRKEPFPCFRVVNGNDCVTMLPPSGIDMNIPLIDQPDKGVLMWPDLVLDKDGKPYTHLGTEVRIKRYSNSRVSVAVNPDYKRTVEVPKKDVDWKEYVSWEKLVDFVKSPFADHLIDQYISILASDLRNAIKIYKGSAGRQKRKAKLTVEDVQKEIKGLAKERRRLEEEAVFKNLSSQPDNTRVYDPAGSEFQQASAKLNACKDAICEKRMERDGLQGRINSMDSGYGRGVLDEITDAPMDGYLEAEFDYQLKNITY
ncbi:hypothetical protein ACFL5V_08975, partial [Fibrobacterota bacterium]